MNFSVEIDVDPVAKENLDEVEKIITSYGFKVSHRVSHVEDKEVVFTGYWRLEKISQVHVKHWALSSDLPGRRVITKWKGRGIYIEHNPTIEPL